jgi:DNA-binding FadR family transcriptional regulator
LGLPVRRHLPSYEKIAEKARCCRDTVYEAIIALEATGVFSWVNRIDGFLYAKVRNAT